MAIHVPTTGQRSIGELNILTFNRSTVLRAVHTMALISSIPLYASETVGDKPTRQVRRDACSLTNSLFDPNQNLLVIMYIRHACFVLGGWAIALRCFVDCDEAMQHAREGTW